MYLFHKYTKLLQLSFVIVVFYILYFSISPSDTNPFWRLPPLISWLPILINDSVDFLLSEWMLIEFFDSDVQEYKKRPLLLQFTRIISGIVLFLIEFFREILLGGVETIVVFTSWDFVSENEWAKWPALPWTVVAGGAILLGHKLHGKGLALFVAFSVIYISAFGQWKPAMQTLSFVMVAAPISFALGLALGIWAFRSNRVEAALNPLLNVAQTMPHYSYLVPIMVLFGVGDHAGAIATIIFATPPMVRLTLLGLKRVPPEVLDAGKMNGCGSFQLLFRVLIPTARRDVLIGVNQVIMQCLAMAVIASFIGAKGLGWNLLLALNQLRIGLALESGVCIVLIAVALDKMSLAWAHKQSDYFSDLSIFQRNKHSLTFIVVLLCGSLLAYIGTFIFKEDFNYFYIVPHNKGLTTEPFWQLGIDWIWDTFFFSLKYFNVFLITNILVPMKNSYLAMPVSATFVLVMGVGYIIGGIRSAAIVCGFLLFIAMTEWWDRALITAYMATFGVIISSIIGISIGSICAQNSLSSRIALTTCDTFQTFPSFIYLIPVIMLFGVTDTSVLIAVVIYATIPAVRYTVEGLRSVPQSLHDAGSMSGVSRLQRLLKVEFPLAFPHVMLGVNQTVVFALFMVIIGAMIGTDDLGQLILKALSEKQGIGNGLTLGLCVAFMGLLVDHLILRWSVDRKQALGIV
jgi:glycine betaine/proline transport system permease protein